MQGYQQQVNTVPGPAVAGDFATMNTNRFTFLAGPGGLVSGGQGVLVGNWGWTSTQGMDPDNAPTIVNNFPSVSSTQAPSGFIAREQQGLNTVFLLDASMLIPQGLAVTLYTDGDFWVVNSGTTAAIIGNKAYASTINGTTSFAPSGAPQTASIAGAITAQTGTLGGYVVGNTLTVLALPTGTIAVGALLSGTVGGSGVTANTYISGQLSGTPGGVGNYSLSQGEQLVGAPNGSVTLNWSWGLLNVTGVTSGTVGLGGIVTGGGTSPGTVITQRLTGSGGLGTYAVNNSQGTSPTNVGSTVETGYFALSAGQPGELIKISRRLNA
jgi:hypothetical protein